jgi:hypothetical protein
VESGRDAGVGTQRRDNHELQNARNKSVRFVLS